MAEVLKRRVPGLHQVVTLESIAVEGRNRAGDECVDAFFVFICVCFVFVSFLQATYIKCMLYCALHDFLFLSLSL